MRALILMLFLIMGAQVQGACRHALVLALDISGSVDRFEYDLQLRGVAAALRDGEIQDLVLSDPDNPIELSVFEWNAPRQQSLLLDWTELTDEDVMVEVAEAILRKPKFQGKRSTAIGNALQYAKALMDERADCKRRTIDISGDGRNNAGITPLEFYARERMEDITVNALVVGQPFEALRGDERSPYSAENLRWYFETKVIRGHDAFTEVALGYRDYAEAIKRKLIRELAPLQLSGLPYETVRMRLAGLMGGIAE